MEEQRPGFVATLTPLAGECESFGRVGPGRLGASGGQAGLTELHDDQRMAIEKIDSAGFGQGTVEQG